MHEDPLSEELFNELFDAYIRRVHDYIYAICRSAWLADECTQDVFLIIWRKRGDLHKIRSIDQYIFRIARNMAIKLLKKAALDSRLANQFYRDSLKHTDQVVEESNRKSAQELIDRAVMSLPSQPRKIYLLSREEQLSFDEIADRTGLSRNTVKNHLQKALTVMREYLVRHGYRPIIAIILLKLLASPVAASSCIPKNIFPAISTNYDKRTS